MTRPCTQEAKIATLSEQVTTLFHKLNGDGGEKGLIERMEESLAAINSLAACVAKIESYNHIKSWIMGVVITLLFGAVCFMATELYHTRLG